MEKKYVIIDLRTMDYMKDENKNIIFYDTEEEAYITCGFYEFEDVWVCQLVFHHIEKEGI